MIRHQAGLDVRRFCALAGIPTTTWYRQRQRALGGRPEKGAVAPPGARPGRGGRARLRAALPGVGPCYKAAAFARYIRSRPEFEHVRTRHRSPETNGVIERFYGSIKYEHLYLQEIDDGPALAEHVAGYQQLSNDERPHEAIDWALPGARYTATPS